MVAMITGVGGGAYDARLARLRRLRRHIDSLELRFAVEAAEFASLPEFTDDLHADSAVSVLRDECRMTAGAAAQAITVGEQQPRLGLSSEALLAGRIGFRHLSLIAYTAADLTQSPTSRGFSELTLLEQARRISVKGLIRACALYRQLMDPQACLQDEVLGAESRFLELRTDDNGAVWLKGWLENESGALLKTALEPLAAPADDGDHRSQTRRQADALVELVGGALPPAQVQVATTVEALAQLAGAAGAELEAGMPISLEALRRQACDCSLIRVLLSGDSQVLDTGRAVRTVTPAQRRALNSRDRGCRFPACERPARYCAGHHLRHWAAGGETNLDNLVLLCRRHHFLVHEGGWRLEGNVRDGFVALPPRPSWLADVPAA